MKCASLATVVALLLVSLGLGCKPSDIETVSKCYPKSGDCEAIVQKIAAAEAPVDTNTGERSYRVRCSSCHALDGKGTGHPGQGDFSSANWHQKFRDAEIMTIIRTGKGMKMPGQHVPANEMKALIQHIRSLSADRKSAKPVPKTKSY